MTIHLMPKLLSFSVIAAAVLMASDKLPENRRTDAGFEEIEGGELLDPHLLVGSVQEAFSNRERYLCEIAERIIINPERTEADENRLSTIIRVLPRFGAYRSAELFSKHLAFKYRHGVGGLREEQPWQSYPCVEAIVHQGRNGLSELAQVIAGTDDQAETELALMALTGIGDSVTGLAHPKLQSSDRGVLFATAYLTVVANSEIDGQAKLRLTKAAEMCATAKGVTSH